MLKEKTSNFAYHLWNLENKKQKVFYFLFLKITFFKKQVGTEWTVFLTGWVQVRLISLSLNPILNININIFVYILISTTVK